MKLLLSRGILFTFLLSTALYANAQTTIGEAAAIRNRWRFFPGVNGGYNKLLEGFDGYDDLGKIGVDLYCDPPETKTFGKDTLDSMVFRFSGDWFPLQVPEQVNGLEEDIYALNVSLLYRIKTSRRYATSKWNPYLGFGLGMYQDRITLNTPATGSVEGKDNHFGMVFSAGVFLPPLSDSFPIRIIPEIRYHRIRFVSSYVSSMNYQIGLAWWPKEKNEK